MALVCTSYCSHGGRCTQKPGHEGGHDSGYCQWTDANALTKTQADAVLAQKEAGRDYLDYVDPMASLIEGLAGPYEEDE